MVIWNGFGFIVAVITFLSLLAVNLLLGDAWATTRWAPSAGLILATILTYAVDHFFFTKQTDKTLMDKETGKDVILRKNHSLFFIPVRYWPYILGAIAVLVFIFDK